MRNTLLAVVAVAFACSAVVAIAAEEKAKDAKDVPAALNFTMDSLDGKPVELKKYQGKVLLMVNVASKCGNTKQYKPLQAAYEKYKDQGFMILGFPANDFKGQEPGSNEDIAAFCEKNYGVKFDLFSKIVVKGEGQHPLYKYLTAQQTSPQPAGDVTWNFEKFLIGKDGKVAARFAPKTQPDAPEVVKAIEAELAK